MRILVDTCVWSLALRRRHKDLSGSEQVCRYVLDDLIRAGCVVMLGPIRQELLSGLRDEQAFHRLREHLRAFDDEPILTDDYEEAAAFRNRCAARGISASPIDMLLCSVAVRLGVPIFTTDADFAAYATVLNIQIPAPAALQERLRGKP